MNEATPCRRPYITLKLATTLDGRMATKGGESQWITGPDSRRAVHELRAAHDAVLIGSGTALADDPELTVRLPGYEGYQPARVILDSKARLPLSSKLAQTARVLPTYLVSVKDIPPQLQAMGVKPIKISAKYQKVDLAKAMQALVDLGFERLFVEGGSVMATAFLKAGFIDRLEWFRAPTILGGDAKPVFGALNLLSLTQQQRFVRLSVQGVGDDLWESYEILSD